MLIRPNFFKILKIAVCLFIAITAVFLLADFVLAAAGPDLGLDKAVGTGLSNAQDIRVIIVRIIRIIFGFLGIIAVGLIMYAGWLWMTSEGSEDKIEQAKKILQNAVIGLIIIISAFAIVSFILNKLMGATDGSSVIPPGSGNNGGGISALGNGIIESHYPARDQKDVPRNVNIIITFREKMQANTLCKPKAATPDSCAGDDIETGVVRIFMRDEAAKCAIDYSASSGCTSLTAAKVYSLADGKTFVFDPIDNLGSPNGNIEYSVYLGGGLLRQSGEKAFPEKIGDRKDYGWSFEVSNRIDLTPPQVKRGEIIPATDNIEDDVLLGVGQPAEGSITVNARPSIYSDASVLSVNKPMVIDNSISPQTDPPTEIEAPWSNATATVNKNCDKNGALKVNVDTGGIIKLKDSNNILLGQGAVSGKTVSFSLCNLKLTLDSGDFAAGNLWTVTIKATTAADNITVGGTTYIASNTAGGNKFKVEATEVGTAKNIVDVLASNQDVTASLTGKVIKLTAKVAGAAGNSIVLSSSNSATLEISAMSGGSDKEDKVTVNGKRDQPMNSAIQINFNEAIMPLTVSGTADDLENYIRVVNATSSPVAKDGACTADADCKSFTCSGGVWVGDNEYLKGKFTVSNQYSTVEFLSDKECGVNNCGEKIYCLPANSHLKVELLAANLIPCAADDGTADNTKCQTYSPFNICDASRKFCRDRDNEKNYYPKANLDITKPNIIDGITDAAFNSLDGNRDGAAYGPASFYNENLPENTDSEKSAKALGGDSYEWSFFISDKLDLTPPIIKETTPIINGNVLGADLVKAIKISFNKLMLSSRLTSGSLMIQNGKDRILHYLLNLRSFIDQPLGYWVTNEGKQTNPGGEIDRTDVYINHTSFSGASSYKAQAGSGLKDIYQNCFLPCSSEAIQTTLDKPSCCNGEPTNSESCP